MYDCRASVPGEEWHGVFMCASVIARGAASCSESSVSEGVSGRSRWLLIHYTLWCDICFFSHMGRVFTGRVDRVWWWLVGWLVDYLIIWFGWNFVCLEFFGDFFLFMVHYPATLFPNGWTVYRSKIDVGWVPTGARFRQTRAREDLTCFWGASVFYIFFFNEVSWKSSAYLEWSLSGLDMEGFRIRDWLKLDVSY